MDLGGYPVIVSDTAGLHTTDDIVEKEGVARALNAAENADAALIIIDATKAINEIYESNFTYETFLKNHLKHLNIDLEKNNWLNDKNFLILFNKIDLLNDLQIEEIKKKIPLSNYFLISILNDIGVNNVIDSLKNVCKVLCGDGLSENPTLTDARHRTHIGNSLNHLEVILGINQLDGFDYDSDLLNSEKNLVYAAYHLQLAAEEIGYVIGKITNDDILGCIFSSFCIGK